MREGHVDAITREAVTGWAANAKRPEVSFAVSVIVDGVKLGNTPANKPHPDLVRSGRFGDGPHGFRFEFPQALDPSRDHHVVVQFVRDGVTLQNGDQLLRAGMPSPHESQTRMAASLSPIMVTAPGRSGTTLLMGLLTRSPAIVGVELIPYEIRLMSYYATAFTVMTAPADLERSMHPDHLQGDGFFVGNNPFNAPQYRTAFQDAAPLGEYFDTYTPARFCAFARDMIGTYYGRLAADKGKADARYFAEKGNNMHGPTRRFMRRAYDTVREIVIVRDPRDVLCSHMAYFTSSAETAFTQLSGSSRQFQAIRAEARSDTHIIRYEDLVRSDATCFAGLSGFLGTSITPESGDRPQEVFRRHATSASPEASVGRWRTNMPADLQERCLREWGGFLAEFGYDAA